MAESGPLAVYAYPDGMFFLIELLVKLILLPLKILWELIELLAHTNHRSHRRRHR